MLGEYSLANVIVCLVILAVNESVNIMAEEGDPTVSYCPGME